MTIYSPDISVNDLNEVVPGRPGTVQFYLRDIRRIISVPRQFYVDTWRKPHTPVELLDSGAIRIHIDTASDVQAGYRHLEIGGD